MQSAETPTEDRSLERRLVELLDGCVLVGRYTRDGQSGDDLRGGVERYTIESCRPAGGDQYDIRVRIQYDQNDVTVPLRIRIAMADQTPVITVDRLWVPGLGTFDSRVLIRDRRYAGTWSHDGRGGHLFGSIEPLEQDATEAPPSDVKNDDSGVNPQK